MTRAWPWTLWAAATLVGFGVLETAALRDQSVPTLSAVLRYWLGIHPAAEDRAIRSAVAYGAITSGLVALAVHLANVPETPLASSSP